MLRALVVLVVLANLLFLAWTQGWLSTVMAPPRHGLREPERLSAQIRPEVVRVLPSGPGASAAAGGLPASAAAVAGGPAQAASAGAAAASGPAADPAASAPVAATAATPAASPAATTAADRAARPDSARPGSAQAPRR